jgi:hypothetical protein
MSVYYYQGAPIVAPFTIVSNEPMFDAETVSLKKQRATQGAQRWEMSFTTVPTETAVGGSFVDSLKDFHLPDSMVMPQLKQVLESYTFSGSVNTLNSSAAGDITVDLNNTSGGQSGIIPKGYFVKFANHDKVYVVTEDVNLSGSTNRAMKIYPALTESVGSNVNLKVENNCTFVFFRSIDSQRGITFSDGILATSGTINLEEAI